MKYIREKWDLQGKRTWWSWHTDWARKAVKQTVATATGRGSRGNQILGQLVEHNRRFIRGNRDQKFFASFDDATLASMKYVYFPMHKETDLPLVFQAPRWHDQANTLRILAGALPWLAIAEVIDETLQTWAETKVVDVQDILEADRAARNRATELVERSHAAA